MSLPVYRRTTRRRKGFSRETSCSRAASKPVHPIDVRASPTERCRSRRVCDRLATGRGCWLAPSCRSGECHPRCRSTDRGLRLGPACRHCATSGRPSSRWIRAVPPRTHPNRHRPPRKPARAARPGSRLRYRGLQAWPDRKSRSNQFSWRVMSCGGGKIGRCQATIP